METLETLWEQMRQLRRMIDNPKICTPTPEQATAMDRAATLLEKEGKAPRSVAMLRYHALTPKALIFRDHAMVNALRDGAAAIERHLEGVKRRGR